MQRIALTTALLLVSLSLLLSAPLQNRSVLISNEEPLTLINSKINPFISQSEGNSSGQIREFEMLGENIAWLLSGNQLLRTEDNGITWNGITPGEISSQGIAAIDFIDPNLGWLVETKSGTDGIPNFSFFSTEDGGINWESWPLDLFDPSDPGAVSNSVTLSMQDSLVGWLMVKKATSSNFSSGELFTTVDGGHSWQKLTIPIGAEVFFIDSDHGWTAGGAASDELYVTRDGGMSWRSALNEVAAASPGDLTQLPVSNQSGRILLPLVRNTGGKSQILFQTSNDKGNHWEISATQNFEDSIDSGVKIPLSSIGEEQFIFHLPGSGQLFKIDPQTGTTLLLAESEQLRGISTIQMISPTTGWVLRQLGSCQEGICRQQSQILATEDGWQSWRPISLPPLVDDHFFTTTDFHTTDSQQTEIADLSLTLTLQGQAFDKCEIPTLDKLQEWFTHSPYKTVNLYIGGSSRACANSALTGPFIHSMSEQGWRFIPTWVGPQAYCSSYSRKIPKDKNSAYQAGIDEATAAIDKAASLGLTEIDKSGSVIYYDLESFSYSDTACLESARSFVSGWSYQMKVKGNVPGLYSTASILNQMNSITNRPDVIWLAHWIYDTYNSNANTDSPYLDDAYWANHQRIRQYTGSHSETWGTTTLSMDSNVMDGMVSDITGTYPLSVVKSGNGKGTIVSNPAGIDCGINCYINFPPNSTIKLTATPSTGSSLTGWSSNCVVTTENECQVTIDKYKEVTATFTLNSYELAVGLLGNGGGKVTSSPSGIDCGSDCKENYPYGSKVTLTAVPASNSTLSSWSGPCTITGELTCEVTIDLANQVTATFKLAHLLTINKNGNGKGTVTSNPAGINCGGDCSQNYEVDLNVTLTAAKSPGSVFTGWTGPCSSTTATTCTVKMDQARQIIATFTTNHLFMPWTGKD